MRGDRFYLRGIGKFRNFSRYDCFILEIGMVGDHFLAPGLSAYVRRNFSNHWSPFPWSQADCCPGNVLDFYLISSIARFGLPAGSNGFDRSAGASFAENHLDRSFYSLLCFYDGPGMG